MAASFWTCGADLSPQTHATISTFASSFVAPCDSPLPFPPIGVCGGGRLEVAWLASRDPRHGMPSRQIETGRLNRQAERTNYCSWLRSRGRTRKTGGSCCSIGVCIKIGVCVFACARVRSMRSLTQSPIFHVSVSAITGHIVILQYIAHVLCWRCVCSGCVVCI